MAVRFSGWWGFFNSQLSIYGQQINQYILLLTNISEHCNESWSRSAYRPYISWARCVQVSVIKRFSPSQHVKYLLLAVIALLNNVQRPIMDVCHLREKYFSADLRLLNYTWQKYELIHGALTLLSDNRNSWYLETPHETSLASWHKSMVPALYFAQTFDWRNGI